jgi:hypothetical protein
MLTKKLTLADATTAHENLIITAYNRARPEGEPPWHELGSSRQRELAAVIVRGLRGRAKTLGLGRGESAPRENRR